MPARKLDFESSGLGRSGWNKIASLDSPWKIQDFLNRISFNFERKGETYRSVKGALAANEAHCFEGALVAAAALWAHGERPLIMDLSTALGDDDHVVALFRRGKHWGAISKTNHAVLRYRDPVYRDPRELAMSYFNEYFMESGEKTMVSFSNIFDLSRQGKDWLNSEEELFPLVTKLDRHPHVKVVSRDQAKILRKADKIERHALKLVDWKKR